CAHTEAVRKLVVGRLTCTAFDDGERRGYRFTGQGTYAALLPGGITPMVVTPAGVGHAGLPAVLLAILARVVHGASTSIALVLVLEGKIRDGMLAFSRGSCRTCPRCDVTSPRTA